MDLHMLFVNTLIDPKVADLLKEGLSISRIAGIVVWITLFVIQTKLVKNGKLYNWGLRRVEKAIQDGHVVKAYRTKSKSAYPGGDRSRAFMFHHYEYEVDGVTYEKIISLKGYRSSAELTLYYTSSPKNAKTRSEMRGVLPDILPMLSSLLIAAGVLAGLAYLGL